MSELRREEGSIVDYNNSAIEAAKLADSGTKQVFESLVADEERHLDRWEKQLGTLAPIVRFGSAAPVGGGAA